MYFWKVDKLVDDFKAGKVSQKEEFKYMLAFSMLMVLITDPVFYETTPYNLYGAINTISLLIVSIWGVYYCYKVNEAGDNKDFIVRVTCIGLPVIVRVLVFGIPIIVVGVIINGFIFGFEKTNSEVNETSIYSMAAGVVVSVISYIYLARKMRAVSS
ncbi:MAG: hypothetical protein WC236_10840 [Gallionellaceae bacterium]|jgi:hypothetical protein